MNPSELKNFKSQKIKSNSIIEDGAFKKCQLETLINIFEGHYIRALKQNTFEYKFGFSYLKNIYILRYH